MQQEIEQFVERNQTISIDLGTDLGPVKHVASGFLFGFSRDGLRPPPAISLPLTIKWIRYSAPVSGCTEIPWTTRSLAEGIPIENQQVIISDGWGYSKDPTENKYANWENFVEETVTLYKNKNLHPQYDIWNEPDASTFWHWSWDQYLETWRRAYIKIRQTDPKALICGGSFAFLNPTGTDIEARNFPNPTGVNVATRFREWLEYCKTNDVVPDYITWHFPDDYVGELSECRRLISTMGLTSVRGIILNEIVDSTWINSMNSCEYTGTLMYDICQTERCGADGAMHACWDGCVDGSACWNGSLDGILVNGEPTGKYYIYERYARISGQIVQTTPAGKLELFAAKESATGIASAIFGSSDEYATINLEINGLSKTPYLIDDGKVHVYIEKIMATGPQEACTPSMISVEIDKDFSIKGDSLIIPFKYDGKHYPCYLLLSKPKLE